MVKQVSEEVFIPLTVGGGLRIVADVRRMLEAGADKASLNTAAVSNPGLVAEASDFFGAQCIVVAIDAKRVTPEDETGEINFQVAKGLTEEVANDIALDEHSGWQVYVQAGARQWASTP